MVVAAGVANRPRNCSGMASEDLLRKNCFERTASKELPRKNRLAFEAWLLRNCLRLPPNVPAIARATIAIAATTGIAQSSKRGVRQ